MRKSPLILVPLLLAGCLDDGCGNEVLARFDAPGSSRSAMLFARDCGATTSFSTQISILPQGETPHGAGNAFVATGGSWGGPGGGPWAEMRWLAADRLLVRYAADARIIVRREAVAGVRITYRAEAIPAPK